MIRFVCNFQKFHGNMFFFVNQSSTRPNLLIHAHYDFFSLSHLHES